MSESCRILVVGAGPAGLAAAAAASKHGAQVSLLDAQPRAGGQVWRHDLAHALPRNARRAIRRIAAITHRPDTCVIDADAAQRTLLVETAQSAETLHWDRLILATGARELLLPFPGWTLPGVTGAGGLQALVKQGWPIGGRRVVVAGSGPLLLAVAATLRKHGAQVLRVIEQAPRGTVHAFARSLWRWPDKLCQAARLRAQLRAVPLRHGSVVRRALGDERLQAVEIESRGRTERIECEQLAVGFGLVPELGLARLLGCEHSRDTHPFVQVDAMQRTSVAGVLAAGESCGIGGQQTAWIEGWIAGCAAAGNDKAARAHMARRDHARRFAAHAARAFALTQPARSLANPRTIVCRCEDVTFGELVAFADARSAKLATRCGMGPCQGRICGAALAELRGWSWHGHPRQPLFPARLASLALDRGRGTEEAAGNAAQTDQH